MKKKNVLIFHTDQQRYDSLGCTGNPYAVTSNIDKLAEEGTLFTRHITSNPACMPSRASFLTGMSTFGHGVTDNGIPLFRNDKNGGFLESSHEDSRRFRGKPLFEKIPTLADVLKESGYKTAAFGKLHFTPLTAKKHLGYEESLSFWEDEETEEFEGPYYGFDKFKVIIGHGEGTCGYKSGHYGRWLKREHPEVLEKIWPGKYRTGASDTDQQIYLSPVPYKVHSTMWLADETCKYIDQHKDDVESNFIFVGFPDPHHPFTPPADFAEEFSEVPKMKTAPFDERIRNKPKAISNSLSNGRCTKEDITLAQHYTNISVALLDKAIGKVIDNLKENGLYDDTIIIFTSDHGDFLGDYDNLMKSWCVSHDLVHVPLIIKGVNNKEMPKMLDTPMSNYDVVPTLLNMLDIDIPYHVQGIDIFSKDAEDNNPISGTCTPAPNFINFSIYDSSYRYTLYPHTEEEELYDHRVDEMELNNLAFNKTSEYEIICSQMKQKLLEKHMKLDTHFYGYSGIY